MAAHGTISNSPISQDATIKLALKGLLEVTEASGKNIEASLRDAGSNSWSPDSASSLTLWIFVVVNKCQ
jgi:hypothetical protein